MLTEALKQEIDELHKICEQKGIQNLSFFDKLEDGKYMSYYEILDCESGDIDDFLYFDYSIRLLVNRVMREIKAYPVVG